MYVHWFQSFIIADPARFYICVKRESRCEIPMGRNCRGKQRNAKELWEAELKTSDLSTGKNSIEDRGNLLSAKAETLAEFEAFCTKWNVSVYWCILLNPFTRDEMCHLCLVPYELGLASEGVSAEKCGWKCGRTRRWLDRFVDRPVAACVLLYQLEKGALPIWNWWEEAITQIIWTWYQEPSERHWEY